MRRRGKGFLPDGTAGDLTLVAGLALGAAGACGVAAAIALLVSAGLEMTSGGLGFLAAFALPYLVAFLGVATLVLALARRVARGGSARAGAVAGVVVAATALVVALNGQWFVRPLEFSARTCDGRPCTVLLGAPVPSRPNPAPIPVAIWGAIAAAAIGIERLRGGARRRTIALATAAACVALAVAGLAGAANGQRATERARRACAVVLAAEEGAFDPWGRTGASDPPSPYLERCADPVAVARSRHR